MEELERTIDLVLCRKKYYMLDVDITYPTGYIIDVESRHHLTDSFCFRGGFSVVGSMNES